MRSLASSGWRSVAPHEFARESAIRLRGSSARGVFQNRFAKARRFTQPHAARDDSFVNAIGKIFPHSTANFLPEVFPAMKNCHTNPSNLDPRFRPETNYLFDYPPNFPKPSNPK